jgi:hypothetical protein
MSDPKPARDVALALPGSSAHPAPSSGDVEALVYATVYVGDQLGRIATLAEDAVRTEGRDEALLNVERTAREVTALLAGGPSSDPPGWTLAGEPIPEDVADPLLRLHDYLNDAERERQRLADAPRPAGFEGETRL